jgi:hypothetical protein
MYVDSALTVGPGKMVTPSVERLSGRRDVAVIVGQERAQGAGSIKDRPLDEELSLHLQGATDRSQDAGPHLVACGVEWRLWRETEARPVDASRW